MNLEREIKINKILLILLITLSVGTIALRTSHAMFSKKETFNNVLRIITGSELPGSGAEDLIEKAGQGGLHGLNPETGELCTSDCKEYRYTGLNVNNYVKLTNLNPTDPSKMQEEIWRIIGIFQDEDNNEWFLRIIKNETLPESYFPQNYVVNGVTYKINDSGSILWNDDSSGNKDWSKTGLQYYLNSEKDSGSNKGYMSYLSTDTKNMLKDAKHYLGEIVTGIEKTITSYNRERDIKKCVNNTATSDLQSGCNIHKGNAATWPGKVGLMYISDYGFSANSEYWQDTSLFYGGYDKGANNTSWMYETMKDTKTKSSWIISFCSVYTNAPNIWTTSGTVAVYGPGSVRPVLNIKSNVRIKKGTEGTETNPYIFEI